MSESYVPGQFKILITTTGRQTNGISVHSIVTGFKTKGEAEFAVDCINQSPSHNVRREAIKLFA
jgi:hypothetical protein